MNKKKEKEEEKKRRRRRKASLPHKEQIAHSSVTQFIAWYLSCPRCL